MYLAVGTFCVFIGFAFSPVTRIELSNSASQITRNKFYLCINLALIYSAFGLNFSIYIINKLNNYNLYML